ncbi:MAG: hypothetical protein QOH73_841, partial [Gaiellaceae bacterium]|nr:hypothetical protein [Gaiellaceae bacterium]
MLDREAGPCSEPGRRVEIVREPLGLPEQEVALEEGRLALRGEGGDSRAQACLVLLGDLTRTDRVLVMAPRDCAAGLV